MPSLQLPPLFSTLQAPALALTNIIALTTPPQYHSLRVLISLPIMIVLLAQGAYRPWQGSWGNEYATNCLAMSYAAVYVDWILLGSPDREGWRWIGWGSGNKDVKEENDEEKKKNGVMEKNEAGRHGAPIEIWGRLKWAARLATTLRYVGWSCQVKNVPAEAECPKWRFVARRALRALVLYLAKDVLYAYTTSSPHGSWLDIVHLKPAVGFSGYPFWHRFWFAWIHIVSTCVTLEMFNSVGGVFFVATGLADPRECPSAFGDPRGMVTVRTAWSSVWHQQLRRFVSSPATFVARDVLHLRRGSLASSIVQLFIAFGTSGLVHGGASMFANRSLDDDGALLFFITQAAVIIVEYHVIDLGRSLGLKDSRFWRVVGWCWTVFALGATSERWIGNMLVHGQWVHERERDWFGIGPKLVP